MATTRLCSASSTSSLRARSHNRVRVGRTAPTADPARARQVYVARTHASVCGHQRRRDLQVARASTPLFPGHDAQPVRPRTWLTRGAASRDPQARASRWSVGCLLGSSIQDSSWNPRLEDGDYHGQLIKSSCSGTNVCLVRCGDRASKTLKVAMSQQARSPLN